jgi:predicted ATPase/DNA-binding SARP family transcriptional activator
VVNVAVLGPLELRAADGSTVKVGSGRQRRLLAALALRRGATTAVDVLAELVWGDDAPSDPAGAVQTNVARLRRMLPDGVRIETEPGGYRLVADLDADDFEAHVTRAAAAADPQRRAAHLDAALLLWRGHPFAELDHPDLAAECVRLGELRASAVEARAEAMVAGGRVDEAVGVLEAFVAEEPLRERPVALLMRALTAAGRQADALRAYGRLRDTLLEQLGLDPSPELRNLEAQVLRQELPAAPLVRRAGPPLPISSFVGRDDDVDALASLLVGCRVVTLAGPGGVGKSRLALHVASAVADRYDDGVTVVPLGTAAGDDVVAALAAALHVSGRAGERLLDRITEVLVVRRGLLVLDDCERVLEEVADVVDVVVAAAPGVDVLATSREPLRVAGEHLHHVGPLSAEASHRLLADRAAAAAAGREVGADDAAVAEVVTRLDGLPLAIELAAARLPLLGAEGLAAALDEPLAVLRGGRRGSRHRSLEDVIRWSYDSLGPDERRLFERVSVFEGGVEAAAVAAVCGTPAAAIADLVDRSLVSVDPGVRPTYRLLDTVRAFGRAALSASGEHEAVCDRHAAWAVELATELRRGWDGAGVVAAVRRFDVHAPDLRVALRRLLAQRRLEELEPIAVLFAEHAFHRMRDDLLGVVDEATAVLWDEVHPSAARFLGFAGNQCWARGDLDEGERRARRSLEIAAELGDPLLERNAWGCLSNVAMFEARLPEAREAIERAVALADELGDPGVASVSRVDLVLLATYTGDVDVARSEADRATALAEGTGSPLWCSWAAYATGEMLAESDPIAAAPHLERAVALAESVDATFVVGVARHTLLTSGARHRDAAEPATFVPLVDHWHRMGAWTQLWVAVRALVEALARDGRFEDVVRLVAASRVSARASAPFGPDADRLASALAAARSAVGDRYDVLVAEGESMGDEGVVAFARSLSDR